MINVNGSIGRGSSAVDINAIPIAAIERVEVLRDGASAQYGSDAIAGVINIVLKGSGRGGSLAVDYGQYSAGDGNKYQLSGDTGVEFGNGRGRCTWLARSASRTRATAPARTAAPRRTPATSPASARRPSSSATRAWMPPPPRPTPASTSATT